MKDGINVMRMFLFIRSKAEDMKAIMCNAYQHMFVEKMKRIEAARREKIRETEVI